MEIENLKVSFRLRLRYKLTRQESVHVQVSNSCLFSVGGVW